MFFMDKVVEQWRKADRVHLGNGVYRSNGKELVRVIVVDLQPYSSSEVKKDYGLDIDVTHAMFYSDSNFNIGSELISHDGFFYEIKEKIVWDEYTEIFLERLK